MRNPHTKEPALAEDVRAKRCTGCGVSKPLIEFSKDKAKRDGHKGQCKACSAESIRRWHEANPEAVREHKRKYQEANREAEQERKRKWREANPEKARESIRKWREENREADLERKRRWYVNNPGPVWAKSYRVRAIKYGFEPVVEPFTRADVIERYGDACAHCGGPFEHLDHYPVPVALGGPHTLENVRPSCAACNIGQSTAIRQQRATQHPKEPALADCTNNLETPR